MGGDPQTYRTGCDFGTRKSGVTRTLGQRASGSEDGQHEEEKKKEDEEAQVSVFPVIYS